ncbi:Hypothetical_protein [Hexamita inflata]|uniref:Hypothetical_protein n=1 Tax=Hexamita inflata TaxID=28002 RepID=A0AA86NUR7_9EUKA|nr:Hypothetical protein HINF_LOCUS14185 [Hexamita inflata]
MGQEIFQDRLRLISIVYINGYQQKKRRTLGFVQDRIAKDILRLAELTGLRLRVKINGTPETPKYYQSSGQILLNSEMGTFFKFTSEYINLLCNPARGCLNSKTPTSEQRE